MVPKTIKQLVFIFLIACRALEILAEFPVVTNTPTAVIARRQGIRYMIFLSIAQ